MKTIKMITAVFAAALMLTACEKDKVNTPNQRNSFTNTSNNNSKIKTTTNKSGGLDEADLSEFITDIIEGNTPSGQEPVMGLLYVESALNYTMTNVVDIPEYQEQFTTTLDITLFSGASTVSGADLNTLYDAVYSTIDGIADTAQIAGTGDKYVTAIDITFDPNDLSAGATAIFSIGTMYSGGVSYSCVFDGDYYIAFNQGGCSTYGNAGTRANEDANDQVSRHIGNRYCNPNIKQCGTSSLFAQWFDVETKPDKSQYSQSTFNTIFNKNTTTNFFECVKESTQSSIAASIESWQATNFPRTSRNGYQIEVKDSYSVDYFGLITV